MKMEDLSTSPKCEDALSQTQDPLERRRLQNRLSQRNHRRKIRERIAKLQERVIANELRAAAALNGWEAHDPSFFPTLSTSQNDVSFPSRDDSPLTSDQCPSFMPFQLFSSQSWSNGLSMSPQHGHPGDLPHYTGAGEASPISLLHMSTPSTTGISPATGLGGELYRELGTSESLLPEALSTAPNQPLYYVATEAALPHIIQVINTMSPQYKVIVLVPPESQVSTSMNSLQSPASPFTPGHNEVDPGSINQQSNSQYLGCLCYPHHIHFGSHMQPTSRSWFGSGQYAQFCPLHKTPIPDSSQGPLPVRML